MLIADDARILVFQGLIIIDSEIHNNYSYQNYDFENVQNCVEFD